MACQLRAWTGRDLSGCSRLTEGSVDVLDGLPLSRLCVRGCGLLEYWKCQTSGRHPELKALVEKARRAGFGVWE